MEFGRNLGRSVRDNPIPVALIGVGIGWLVWSNSRQGGPAGAGGREQPWMRDHRFGGGVERDMYGHYRPDRGMETVQHDLATKAHRAGDEVQREVGEAEDTFQDRVHAARGVLLGQGRAIITEGRCHAWTNGCAGGRAAPAASRRALGLARDQYNLKLCRQFAQTNQVVEPRAVPFQPLTNAGPPRLRAFPPAPRWHRRAGPRRSRAGARPRG